MVRINYTGMGYTCNATNSSFNLVVDVVCNHNIDREHAVPVLLANKSCTYQYLLEVNDACPKVDLSVIFTFINKYLVIFCIGFIVLGIIIGLFGRSMWTTIIFLLFSLTITMLFLVP